MNVSPTAIDEIRTKKVLFWFFQSNWGRINYSHYFVCAFLAICFSRRFSWPFLWRLVLKQNQTVFRQFNYITVWKSGENHNFPVYGGTFNVWEFESRPENIPSNARTRELFSIGPLFVQWAKWNETKTPNQPKLINGNRQLLSECSQ